LSPWRSICSENQNPSTTKLRLQLRGEFFNILNHPNFDVFTMNTDLSVPSNVGTVSFTPDVAASNPVIGSERFTPYSTWTQDYLVGLATPRSRSLSAELSAA
jgi:hypothetical protein